MIFEKVGKNEVPEITVQDAMQIKGVCFVNLMM
jgi:hypothetical protein